MTETPDTRFGLAAISGSDYIHDIDTEDQAQIALLHSKAVGFNVGTLATIPAAGKTGWFYWATDTQTLYYDTGVAGFRFPPAATRCTHGHARIRRTLTRPPRASGRSSFGLAPARA